MLDKNLRSEIKRIGLSLTRRNGDWAIAAPKTVSQKDISFIKGNRQALIDAMRIMSKEKLEQERKEEEEKMKQNIILEWREGNPLSGWVASQNNELMEKLGLSKPISGWGWIVDDEAKEALGTEFTADEARAYAEEKIEGPKREKAMKEEKRKQEVFAKAKETGEKQELNRWTEGCNDPKEECNLDIVTEWAMPDGSTETTRTHTW